jgi:8-amino-7-oxononanoate synthase
MVPGFGQFEELIRRRLRELEEAGLRRTLQPPSGVDLCSNDYLGLSNHPQLKQRMAEAAIEQGCGATASRLLRGERADLSAVEKRFASFKHADASLYFGSGYVANLSVLATFINRQDVVLSDEQNHASIVDGIRLSGAKRVKFRHCDVADLDRRLRASRGDVQRFVITESLFSMDGDFAPLADYAELCRKSDAILIVDEAHAVGVYGDQGSGYIEQTGIENDVFLSINTAGKAMGVAGAFVAGPDWAVDYLVQCARPFMFSTGPVPAIAAALDASLSVIAAEPERRRRVLRLSRILRQMLAEREIAAGNSQSQIIPIILGDNRRAAAAALELQRDGFDVRAIRPPAVPAGSARLRVSINALLEESTLERFASAVQRCREIILCSAVSS